MRSPSERCDSSKSLHFKYKDFLTGQRSIHECWKVFSKSKKEMLDIYKRLMEKDHVKEDEKTLFRYYCEAIIILQHFQKTGVAFAGVFLSL
ncbi:unnamed protein product [Merluccius merluccius]